MHVVVIFANIGSYHTARLRATQDALKKKGWSLTALEVTNSYLEHQWGDLSRFLTFPRETIFSLDHPIVLDKSGQVITQYKEVAGALDRLQPDVVCIPGWGDATSRHAINWCRKKRKRKILMSESKKDDAPRSRFRELLKSYLYVRGFDAALVGGAIHKDYIVSLGLPKERVFEGYDAVDNEYFIDATNKVRTVPHVARNEVCIIPRSPYFLSMNRFIGRKNIQRLIDAYVQYLKKCAGEPWHLVIAGSGELETMIESSIEAYKINALVHVPGFIPYQHLGHWYGLAGAFIHPAYQEQWGLVINEACASGLPILSSDTVGARYDLVREGVNGFLFDPLDTENITSTLLSMHNLDSFALKSMGEASRRLVASLSPEAFASNMISAIEIATLA